MTSDFDELTSTLDDVDRTEDVRWLIQRSRRRTSLDDLLGIRATDEAAEDESLIDHLRILRIEMEDTARSIRRGRSPTTTLYALLLRDNQTVGQIAAMTHKDPRDLQLPLEALIALSLARVDRTRRLPRYSLASHLDD